MPRKKKCRMVDMHPGFTFYKPAGIPLKQLEVSGIEFDEFEAIRLADMEGMYHEDAANRMGISRQTFGRILQSARKKISSAIVKGNGFRFENKQEIVKIK